MLRQPRVLGRGVLGVLLTAGLVLVPWPVPSFSGRVTAGKPETQATEVRLPSHVLPVLAQATSIDPAAVRGAAAERLQITIVLNRTDPTGFSALVRAINDPGSPTYRQFESQAELS